MFSQNIYPREWLREESLLPFQWEEKNKFALRRTLAFYVISRPIYQVSQPFRGLVQLNTFLKCCLEWILPGHGVYFLLLCWCWGILYNVFQKSSPLSSGWSPAAISTFTEPWLVCFFQKQLPCSSTFFPFAARKSLSLRLRNSNKIFPQYFVLSYSQPDFFIHFIILCVQKDHGSNRFVVTLSPQTYSHCFFCIRGFIGGFFSVCFISVALLVQLQPVLKHLQLSRSCGRHLKLTYKTIQEEVLDD